MITNLNEQNHPHDDGQNRPETDHAACFQPSQDRGIEQKPDQSDIAGGRCQRCNEVVSDGRCPRCVKNIDAGAGQSEAPPVHMQAIIDTLKTFILSDEEIAEVKARIVTELKLLEPRFFKCVTIAALMPVIQRRSRTFYLHMKLPFSDAEDLAAQHSQKLWRNLFGGWPTGNAGAWVSTIRRSILADFGRAKKRERKTFKKRNDAALAGLHDEAFNDASFNELVEEARVRSPNLVAQLMRDINWAKTVTHYEQNLKDAVNDIMSLEWDGESVPLRKKRPRQPRPDP